jgi:phytoene synthase
LAHDPPLSLVAEQVRLNDPDRFLTALFAPQTWREELFALFALNDELARAHEGTRTPLIGAMRLQWWRDSLDGIFAGRPPRHPVALALAGLAGRGRIARADVERLIEARETDGDGPGPADLAALEAQVEAAAGTLNGMALRLLGVEDAATHEAARHVAIAFGLVGTLRAIPSHARMGRVMLPGNVMSSEGLAPQDIGRESARRALARVVASVAELAEAHLVAARAHQGRTLRAALPVLLQATHAGVDLARLRRQDYDPFDPARPRAAFRRRLAVAWRAGVGRF